MQSPLVRASVYAEWRTLDEVAAELSALPATRALETWTPYIEHQLGLGSAGGQALPHRFDTLLALDEAAQRSARECIAAYLAGSGAERRAIWQTARNHWSVVLDAYGDALTFLEENQGGMEGRALMALLAVSLIRAGAQLMKWDSFRHGPLASVLWLRVNQAYRLASRAGSARLPVRSRADSVVETCVEREYVRVLALHSVGLDQFDPRRLEIVSRVVHQVLPLFDLAPAPSAASLLWVDVAGAHAPVRLMHMPREGVLPRFFSAMRAARALTNALDSSGSGADSQGDFLRAGEEPVPLRRVLSHLIKVWSNDAPMRRGRRHLIPGQMMVVGGVSSLLDSLHGESGGRAQCFWNIRDVSTRGVGLHAPSGEVDALEVGMLVGLHASDGDRWRVGAVRRMWRGSDEAGEVGVELLGEMAVGMMADDGIEARRVVVLDPIKQSVPVRVILSSPVPRHDGALFLKNRQSVVKLVPLETAEVGADYEVRHYMAS